MIFVRDDEREILMLEYRELLDEILHRRRNTWVIHSVILAATLLISFASSVEPLLLRYGISFGLVVFSWFFQRTATHVNDSCWERRRKIEKKLGMKGPQLRYEKLKQTKSYKIRRRLWPALWFFLGVLYFLLLLSYLVAHLHISFDFLGV